MWETLSDHPEVLYGAALALLIVILLTPAVGGMARLLGVVDRPGGRRLNRGAVPRLGGRALFFGVFVPALAFPPLAAGARFPAARLRTARPASGRGRRDARRGDRRLPRPDLVGEARRPGGRRSDPDNLRNLGAPLHVPGARRAPVSRVGRRLADRALDRRDHEHGQLPGRARRPRGGGLRDLGLHLLSDRALAPPPEPGPARGRRLRRLPRLSAAQLLPGADLH